MEQNCDIACFSLFESPTGTLKKILLPIPQASLSPATIWLEAQGQDVGMCTGLHNFFLVDLVHCSH